MLILLGYNLKIAIEWGGIKIWRGNFSRENEQIFGWWGDSPLYPPSRENPETITMIKVMENLTTIITMSNMMMKNMC